MSAYLKRLDIASVEEVGVETTGTAYLKRVEIVEVVDQDGQPWEPVPGPDPWDELVLVDPSAWANLNNYVVGEEIYADVAAFTGGSDQTILRYRWQTKVNEGDNWTSTGWTQYTGAREVFTTATAGYVRLQSQARDDNDDPVTQVNSFTSTQHVLNVGTANVSGTAFAGETITCSAPTVSGGQQPYTTSYSWSNGAEGQSITLQVADVGNTLTCSVNVHDSAGNHKTFTATGSVGPVGQYTIGTLVPAYDGETYDPNDPPTITEDASFMIWVTQDGTSPNIVYEWEVRAGQARLTPNGGTCTVVNQSAAPGQLAIQVNARDAFANPTGESFRFQFAVIT